MSGPLRVVKGTPDDEELAALVAALAVVAARPVEERASRGGSSWRAALRHRPLSKGDGAWRRALR
jgi:hypothetical protein